MNLPSQFALFAVLLLALPAMAQEIDDRAVRARITKAADVLIKASKVTKASELAGQLKRKTCRITLPAPKAIASNPEELYKNACKGTLIISKIYKCTKCNNWHDRSAGGFAITASGIAATNYHVLEVKSGDHTLVATSHDGKTYPVKQVLAANRADDYSRNPGEHFHA